MRNLKGSAILLGFFSLGLVLGYTGLIPNCFLKQDYGGYALYILLFLVGVSVGADRRLIKSLFGFDFRIVLVPLTTIVGTAIGVSFVFLFTRDYSFTELQAVGAGYGYYSLSSIIIAQKHSETLGVVALLSNIIRELATLLFAPVLALLFGKIAPICSGGATSMDTTLPIVTRVSGREYALVSLLHGVVLTVLVPFLVTMILSW
jgi:uncharacterized membrane protein YbjE (DUF340 family)